MPKTFQNKRRLHNKPSFNTRSIFSQSQNWKWYIQWKTNGKIISENPLNKFSEKIIQNNHNVNAFSYEVKEIVKKKIKNNLSKLKEKNQMENSNNVRLINLKNFLQSNLLTTKINCNDNDFDFFTVDYKLGNGSSNPL